MELEEYIGPDGCRVYWGSHGCRFRRGHQGRCECACCDCQRHPYPEWPDTSIECVAFWPYYGPDTRFYGEDAVAMGLRWPSPRTPTSRH